jgi:hypothetical protein
MRLYKFALSAAILALATSPIVAASARVHARHSHASHAMHGMSHRSQGNPNGSPNAAPTAKEGPAAGDASQHNDAPK